MTLVNIRWEKWGGGYLKSPLLKINSSVIDKMH